MAFKNGPNKTVAAFRRKNPFPAREPRPIGEFMEWVCQKASEGASFSTIDEAREAFRAENGREADS